MASDPSMKLRVDRLQNDADSIYELVGDFRAEFDEFGSETRGYFERGVFRAEFNEFRSETRGYFARIEETLIEVVRRLPESS